jgi:RES domain-containing protein
VVERHRQFIDVRGLRPRLDVLCDLPCFRVTGPQQDALLLRHICPWGGRYHALGEAQCLYCSLDEQTAKREWERRARVPSLGAEVRVTSLMALGRILNLFDADGQRALRVSEEDLVGEDVSLCREVAGLAVALGADGMLVPSAAQRGSANLVICQAAVKRVVKQIKWSLGRL